MRVLCAVTACLAATSTSVDAVPPPPIPPGRGDLVTDLIQAVNGNDQAAYISRMSSGVELSEDGQTSKGLTSVQTMLESWHRKSWTMQPITVAQGGDEIVALERVSNIPVSLNTSKVQDCCWWTRAVAYHLDSSGAVDRISITTYFRASNIRQYPIDHF